MSGLAAAALVAGEGVEPLLHMVTRDRNRIALVSDCLGAQALGIRNFLCTTGTHQTLGPSRSARNVFDIDSVQLLQALTDSGVENSLVGEHCLNGTAQCCFGAVAAPFADPPEMQVARVAKKIKAGARFLITQPVYDIERFEAWWGEVVRRGLQREAAFVAGVRILTSAEEVAGCSSQRPNPRIPASMIDRLGAKTDKVAQRAEGVQIAQETAKRLLALEGLRGVELRCDEDQAAVLEVIENLNLGTE